MNAQTSKELFVESLDLLVKSKKVLQLSHERCSSFERKKEYSEEELVEFEALTSRFARTADILTQKTARALFVHLAENVDSTIDVANTLEKVGIIDSAATLLEIRRIRNVIAHEYAVDELINYFYTILKFTPTLCGYVERFEHYEAKL